MSFAACDARKPRNPTTEGTESHRGTRQRFMCIFALIFLGGSSLWFSFVKLRALCGEGFAFVADGTIG